MERVSVGMWCGNRVRRGVVWGCMWGCWLSLWTYVYGVYV